MARSARPLLAVLVLTIAALVLAACGGGDAPNAEQLLKDTFGPNHPVRSGDLDVGLTLDAKGLQGAKGPIALRLEGPFQSQGKGKLPQFDFTLALKTGASSFTAGAVSTGDKGFLKVQGQTYAVTPQLFQQFKQGYEQAAAKSAKSGAPTLGSLGIDPLDWLKDPQNAGTEDVGGASTYHVTAGIDVAKFLDDVNEVLAKAGSLGQGTKLPSSLSASQRRDIERSVKSAKLDVWTGKDDKTLRRLAVDITFDVPSDVRARAGGLENGELKFNLLIGDLNKPQTINAPSKARPLSDLTSALAGGATGGSSGSSGASSGSSGGSAAPAPSSPPSGASQKYLDCLQKAGSDVAKVQACASQLGQ